MGELDQLSACVTALAAAPFQEGGWLNALDWFARSTGSRAGQFIGRTARGRRSFDIVTSGFEGAQADWIENGGLNPSTSPMVRAGLKAPLLVPYTDLDAVSPDERRRNDLWRSVHESWDIPHVACTMIWRERGDSIVLAALRSSRQGAFEAETLRRQKALIPRWHDAVKLTAALKGEGGRIMAGALDVVGVNAFILDGFGRLIAATRGAESLLRTGKWLEVRQGTLSAKSHPNISILENAIAEGLGDAAPTVTELIATDGILDVQIAKLPQETCHIGLGATLLVICEDRRHIPGLTRAEREIARLLLQGFSLSLIAESRSTSLETVKGQAKAIYAKAGVSGQLELIRRFRPGGSNQVEISPVIHPED